MSGVSKIQPNHLYGPLSREQYNGLLLPEVQATLQDHREPKPTTQMELFLSGRVSPKPHR